MLKALLYVYNKGEKCEYEYKCLRDKKLHVAYGKSKVCSAFQYEYTLERAFKSGRSPANIKVN